jgi:hypothetical protein
MGLGDFLGTGQRSKMIFWKFEKAREFTRKLGLKSRKEWEEYCKSGKKPREIPVFPNDAKIYASNWTGWGDWLGTGTVEIQNHVMNSLPFDEAREFTRKLKLKGYADWVKYRKSGTRPKGIPSNPQRVYKKDFKGYVDWLGNEEIRITKYLFKDFEDAREFVRSLKLLGEKEWKQYCKSGEKPDDIPVVPWNTYKNKGWIGVGDWLGTGRTRHTGEYRSFTEAREFVRSLGLKSSREWNEYRKSGNKPDDIPANPNQTYKNNFKGYGDWLGTGNISSYNIQYRPFKEAREFVRKLGLKSHKEWREYCKSGKKPDDIPSNPWYVYKEWKK